MINHYISSRVMKDAQSIPHGQILSLICHCQLELGYPIYDVQVDPNVYLEWNGSDHLPKGKDGESFQSDIWDEITDERSKKTFLPLLFGSKTEDGVLNPHHSFIPLCGVILYQPVYYATCNCNNYNYYHHAGNAA